MVDCHSRVWKFHFPNEVKLVWEGYNSSCPNPLTLNLNFNKMMSKGLLCHIVIVNDLDNEIDSIDSAPAMNDFPKVLPDYFCGVPPSVVIDLGIDLEPDIK